ncbi:hypothetical protein NECAME_16727 [Necator americanus]|uniref:Uncharacterized protein n=1 Tax=Necator americanus TaxID=51031 RepID=W2TVB9_NECAM|nr:hypothetical protein NECAME_16727 [Necator americanus]ETN85599.1 hypothetical protein NECAME_16727 [Necator americanus]
MSGAEPHKEAILFHFSLAEQIKFHVNNPIRELQKKKDLAMDRITKTVKEIFSASQVIETWKTAPKLTKSFLRQQRNPSTGTTGCSTGWETRPSSVTIPVTISLQAVPLCVYDKLLNSNIIPSVILCT